MPKEEIAIIICDDEKRILKEIEEYVKEIMSQSQYEANIRTTSSPKGLLENLSALEMDILLLDIDMPYVNGMEIARKLLEEQLSVLLIFVTSQESLVYDSFQYQPFSFIRKSRYRDELKDTLLRACKKLSECSMISVKQGNQVVRVKLSDLLYCESDGNYVRMVTKKEELRVRDTLRNLEEQLSAEGFVKIHKGFLVNQNEVFRIQADKVILTNKDELPIGRSEKDNAKRLLMRGFRI